MAANPTLNEEITLATPRTVNKADHIRLMFPLECDFETPEGNPLWFLRVFSGLADLGDHRRIHT
jgi:hypothetical protein